MRRAIGSLDVHLFFLSIRNDFLFDHSCDTVSYSNLRLPTKMIEYASVGVGFYLNKKKKYEFHNRLQKNTLQHIEVQGYLTK